MAMTKKGYELIAGVFKETYDKHDSQPRSWTAYEIAYRLGQRMEVQNPRFNLDTFMKACGMREG